MENSTPTPSPSATVAAIIVSDNQQILLTKRNVEPFKNTWCLPGGHIEQYEKAYEAVKREVKEETGLTFDGTFFGWFEEIFPKMNIHNVVLVFQGSAHGSPADSDEVTAIKWFDPQEAKNLPLAFTHNEIIEAYFSKTAMERRNSHRKNIRFH